VLGFGTDGLTKTVERHTKEGEGLAVGTVDVGYQVWRGWGSCSGTRPTFQQKKPDDATIEA
jgi:hypothetical protein